MNDITTIAPVDFERTASLYPCYDDSRRYTGCIGQTLCRKQRDHCWTGQYFDAEPVTPIRLGGRKPGFVTIGPRPATPPFNSSLHREVA